MDKYISLGAKSIVNTRKLVSVSQCSGAYAYIINLAGARKLNAFLFPVWIESDRWPFLRESAVLKIKAVFPPVGLLSSLNNSSSIWLTSDDIAIRDKVKKDRKKIYHALRQKRSLIAKIRNMFWRIFIRKFFEKNSQQ
ncbi:MULTISPECIES: hypothetical protein [unclassified Erwinia]|uniref:hypothetical protein n=1 Tax=unclassified Erwinia TaxID=2622719 RepID=UPI0013045FAC|nr:MULTISPECIES: hypothetical protein [unclassified Erwinia]